MVLLCKYYGWKLFKYYGFHSIIRWKNVPLEFKRKVIDNHGSLQVNIPVEIAEHLGIRKGDTIAVSLDDNRFVCRKIEK